MKRKDFRIRDTFILLHDGMYYLYGTRLTHPMGFEVYVSENLEDWSEPIEVFRESADFWATKDYWGPEVYFYHDKFYMFANFKADGVCRGTQVLTADSPLGPFTPHSDGPVTPHDQECLDGTLYLDESGNPYMVYCHEWVQCQDGEMCVVQLDEELKKMVSEPIILFRGSEASWTVPIEGEGNFVTDGPFLYPAKNGELLMLWSSISENGFVQAYARSKTGKLTGEWTLEEPLLVEDGGHGMLFCRKDGQLMMVTHYPNEEEKERARLYEMEDDGGRLTVKKIL